MLDRACSWALARKAQNIDGRARWCGSQEGNALLYMIRLGFLDDRVDRLAEKLLGLQWPDGGWNCDKRPEACHSSFNESLIPMRALYLYAKVTGNREVRDAANMTAEMFLERRLFRRKTTGEIIRPRFAVTHYPYFWRYTFLHCLVAMVEANLITDPRCGEALDLLESRRLPDGGFPAERKYYTVVAPSERRYHAGQTLVEWGPTGVAQSNEFVTAESLSVMKAAGRLN